MAHRGNRIRFPENTMPAFRQAIEDGADILETDLHLSMDDEFMCIHDSTLNRTTNSEGPVAKKTLKELKDLQIVDEKSRSKVMDIPTLAELTQIIPQNVALALELKTDLFLEKSVCEKLGYLLDHHGVLERTICISFSLERVKMVKKIIPGMPIGWISMSRLIPDKDVELIGAFWPVMFINPWYVRMAHKKDMLVCPLDPTPDLRLQSYLKMDCDAILTDDPAKTRSALDLLLKK